MSFILKSDAFVNGAIAGKYGKESSDVQEGIPQLSFPLSWEGAPEGTQSFALVFIDYDNVIGEGIIWVHWLAANIPASASGLPEDAGRDPSLLQGKTTWAFQLGVDNPVCNRYGGQLPLQQGFYYNEFLRAIRGKVLDSAVIRGVYPN